VIGIVLVSHSARLADGVVALMSQVGGTALRVAVAAGLEEPPGLLGTDAARVARAIDESWSEDGVLVLVDLGSAILSAEMAMDLIPEERRDRVVIAAAPFVEGAVAAAVAAGVGEPLETVAREANEGLAAKIEHLGAGDDLAQGRHATDAEGPSGPAEAPTLRFTVVNPQGLHARPAAALVRTAVAFDADITVADVTTGRGPASARSLNAVATLGVLRGHVVEARASGPQARQALASIRALADGGFGDPAAAGPPPGAEPPLAVGPPLAAEPPSKGSPPRAGPPFEIAPPPSGSVLPGLPASPGVAIGAARWLGAEPQTIPEGPGQGAPAEWAALRRALAATADEIGRSATSLAARSDGYETRIFDAHTLFLEDEALIEPAHRAVFEDGKSAPRAWADAVAAAVAVWEGLDDPYQRARAADLRGVGDQVLGHLLGRPAGVALPSQGIVVAADLTPAQTAALDRSLVLGIACAGGGPTSHSAILARSLGIPAVVALGESLLAVPEGTLLALEGDAGTVTVEPSPDALKEVEEHRARGVRRAAEARAHAHEPAVTRDGLVVEVAANVSGPAEVPQALAAGADAVGLLRTEFLFLQSGHLPDQEEQERAYRAAAEALAGRPLTLRTLDVGADKDFPYLPVARERNPLLGLRGIRLGLHHPELLLIQLRAALRVAADHRLRIMLPMVTTVEEVLSARALLQEARESLAGTGTPASQSVELGMMVEVPGTALTAQSFVAHVDFFSVGTNDLAQYALAAERGNAAVAALADGLHPAVLQLIERTASVAAEGGLWVGVCGEVAADPLAVPLLLGLGVTELSLTPSGIPIVKQAVRTVEADAARRLAGLALAAGSSEEVRDLARRFAGG
jgi:phosphoenolpyruvate-protein phosphotransferase/dihydroxyacetone kinase phosphotransfer subunit